MNISGCDSCSAFHGIGKIKWFKNVSKSKYYQDALALLGEELDVSQSLFNALEELICKLYGIDYVDINVVR